MLLILNYKHLVMMHGKPICSVLYCSCTYSSVLLRIWELRLRNLLLTIILVLIQVLVPWVHAHTGTETGGGLHMPGLESMGSSDPAYTSDASAYQTDVIVAVQFGIQKTKKAVSQVSAPDDTSLLYLRQAVNLPSLCPSPVRLFALVDIFFPVDAYLAPPLRAPPIIL